MTNRIPGKDLVRGCGMSTQFRSTQGRTEVSVKISCQKPQWLFFAFVIWRETRRPVCAYAQGVMSLSLSVCGGSLSEQDWPSFPEVDSLCLFAHCQEGEGEAKQTSFGTTSVSFWKVPSGIHVPLADDIGTFSVFPELCRLSENDFIELPSEDS